MAFILQWTHHALDIGWQNTSVSIKRDIFPKNRIIKVALSRNIIVFDYYKYASNSYQFMICQTQIFISFAVNVCYKRERQLVYYSMNLKCARSTCCYRFVGWYKIQIYAICFQLLIPYQTLYNGTQIAYNNGKHIYCVSAQYLYIDVLGNKSQCDIKTKADLAIILFGCISLRIG